MHKNLKIPQLQQKLSNQNGRIQTTHHDQLSYQISKLLDQQPQEELHLQSITILKMHVHMLKSCNSYNKMAGYYDQLYIMPNHPTKYES